MIAAWNFASGWNVDQLITASAFYDVDDVDMLLRLALVIRQRTDEQRALRDAK